MIRLILAITLALFSTYTLADIIEAEVIKETTLGTGDVVQLHVVVGPCVKGAKLATWVSKDRSERVQGCYAFIENGEAVSIAWFDGDGTGLATRRFKDPANI